MKKYRAVLFAPDGSWVTDFEADTKEEVKSKLADKGSRWYFYPLEGIILSKGIRKDSQRLLDVAPNFDRLAMCGVVGKSIKTVSKWLAGCSSEEISILLGE